MNSGAKHREMVRAMCAAVDNADAESFGKWFAENATYTFGNGETVVGRSAIVSATADAAGALPWIRHVVDEVTEAGEKLFCEFTIETAAPTGETLRLPCLTLIRLSGDVVVDYRVHMDMTPAIPSA